MQREKRNICIIGYGRFGKLLTQLLAPYGDVFIIEKKYTNKIPRTQKISVRDLGRMDWIIPAVPIHTLKEVLQKINPHLKKGALVMDVSSVKVLPCRWLKKYIRRDVHIIGAHPMFGPDSAQYGLNGLQVILCPLRVSQKIYDHTVDIFENMGLTVITTTPSHHDREAAKSLAMVHFLGRALCKIHIRKQKISSLGFERLLTVNETVSNDTWALFWDMQRYNPYTQKVRKDLIDALITLDQEIMKGKNQNKKPDKKY